MPYKDPEDRRRFQREWVAERRRLFLDDKRCAFCNSADDLELHHFDPETKLSHNIWSWSQKRREDEIAKCVVLCRDCHTRRHREVRATHCKYGHEFTAANTYTAPSGRRECRTCRTERRAAA